MRTNWFGVVEDKENGGVVQIDNILRAYRAEPLRLSTDVLRLAHAEYSILFPGHSFEEIQERGGFSVLELVGLLADALEREKKR